MTTTTGTPAQETTLSGKSGTGFVSLTGAIVTKDTCHGTVWCQCGCNTVSGEATR